MKQLSLSEVSSFLKQKEVIGVATLIIVIAALSIFEIVSLQTKALGWQDQIFPGKTTKKQLEKIVGKPVREQTKEGLEIWSYSSGNRFRLVQVTMRKDKVILVVEPVLDDKKLISFRDKLGKEEAVIYGKYGTIIPAYFWGSKGVLLFASPENGEISEIWYFPRSNLNGFLQDNPGFKIQPTVAP
ncbi:MAG TPA: hypothetical protein VLE47_04230 [Candidatus Saccharimonadales bacterium]|nr:hypothetical protein [Candidatus Saccharimonadales bacterium]